MGKKKNKNIRVGRLAKRANNRLKEQAQTLFGSLCEMFSVYAAEKHYDYSDTELVAKFNKCNEMWKTFARKVVSENLHYYDDAEKRITYINTFENFVNKIIDQNINDGDIKQPIAKVADFDWSKEPIEKLRGALQEAVPREKGYTRLQLPGIAKIVSELDTNDLQKFLNCLQGVK